MSEATGEGSAGAGAGAHGPGADAPTDAIPLPNGVLEALRALEKPKANWMQGLLLLAVTAVLFAGGHWLEGSAWANLPALAIALMVHELGHYVAMRAFGYRDLRVFFLPFFGAAASGRKFGATGTQRAIVALAGPVPSLALAFVVALLAGLLRGPRSGASALSAPAISLAAMMLLINVFNLLPFEPLDGGAFLRIVLFSRAPAARIAFRAVGALAAIAGGIALRAWLLVGLGVMMLFGLKIEARIASAVRKLAPELDDGDSESAAIPDSRLRHVAKLVRTDIEPLVPSGLKPPAFASYMRTIWDRAHERPPPARHAALLMGSYLLVVGAIALVSVTVSGRRKPTQHAPPSVAASASARPSDSNPAVSRVTFPDGWVLGWSDAPTSGWVQPDGRGAATVRVVAHLSLADAIEAYRHATLTRPGTNASASEITATSSEGRDALRFDYVESINHMLGWVQAVSTADGVVILHYYESDDAGADAAKQRADAFYASTTIR